MPTLSESMFTAYTFTEDELQIAATFSDEQTAYIQSERALIATQKLALPFDPTNPNQFAFEHEYYRGKMDAFTELLTISEALKSRQNELLENNRLLNPDSEEL